MEIAQGDAKTILTPQKQGFLASDPYPFTHTLSGYVGCGFGATTCGLYCYAQYLPSWTFRTLAGAWGAAVQVKTNAATVLEQTLGHMRPMARRTLRIFMSSTTDPYQPLEGQHKITRHCLQVFARYGDLDLLVAQTRSPLALRDLDLLHQIPYAWLSVSIETDDQGYLKRLKGGPLLEKRWELVRTAAAEGVRTQITVSPCLPFSSVAAFGERLLASGAKRVVVDTPIDGDGTHGTRTARSPFAAAEPCWHETTAAHELYAFLSARCPASGVAVGWSTAGFCGIPPRAVREPAWASRRG
jgi:DNA repair photolyase